MTQYAANCYDLGFLCEWQARGEMRPATVTALAEHINEVHDTGTTSPALHGLIGKWIHEVDEDSNLPGGARRERPYLQRNLDRLVDSLTLRRRATASTENDDQEQS